MNKIDGSAATAAPQRIVKSYAQEFQRLEAVMTQMGGLVENQVAMAAQAMADRDADLAGRTAAQDKAVDGLERQAEQMAIRMLALRAPVASDLRQVLAVLKIVAALERIGDYAKNVAKRTVVLSQFMLPFKLTGLITMARLVQENLKLVIDAAGEKDAARAMVAWHSDQAIDDLYNSVFRELITYMMEDARNITPCAHLLFIAKNLERIGDHATNIAETVHYAATGVALSEDRPKGADNTGFDAAVQDLD